jgi:hypothetical protein
VVNLLAVLEARPFAISEASLHQLLYKAKDASTGELLAEDRVQRVSEERDAAVVRALREAVALLADAHEHLGFREFLAWTIERTPLRFELARAGVPRPPSMTFCAKCSSSATRFRATVPFRWRHFWIISMPRWMKAAFAKRATCACRTIELR